MKLRRGQYVQLKTSDELLEIFNSRNFFSDDSTRKRIVKDIGGKTGIVEFIEDKYAYDYFFFKIPETGDTYSIPYESVKQL